MIGKYNIVKNDLFGICKRIKQIDKGYFIVYSYKLRRFEIHNSYQKRGGSFCLVVPYDCLDARVLDLVLKTKSENAKELFLQIERDNARLLKESREMAVKNAENQMENLLSKM